MSKIPRSITKLMRYYLILFVIVFTVFMVCSIFFIGQHYLRKSIEMTRTKVDQAAQLIIKQLRIDDQLPPKRFQGDYLVFIVDGKSGSYILERETGQESERNVWTSYRGKIAYEMQKKKRGWVYYPQKDLWQISIGERVVRYLPVEELDWIIAVEAKMESDWVAFKNILTKDFLSVILLITALGVYALYFLTALYLSLLEKYYSSTFKSTAMDFHKDVSPDQIEINKSDYSESETVKNVLDDGSAEFTPVEEEASPITSKTEGIVPEESKPSNKEALQKEEAKEQIKKNDESQYDDMTIDVEGIKSPILKKMINEMRKK